MLANAAFTFSFFVNNLIYLNTAFVSVSAVELFTDFYFSDVNISLLV